MPATFFHEEALSRLLRVSSHAIVGIDEVGRGALAGPVCACAVSIVPSSYRAVLALGVRDSKMLPPHERQRIADALRGMPGVRIGLGLVGPQTIDALNIRQATFVAMRRALDDLLLPECELLLVDGVDRVPSVQAHQQALVAGDARSATIACASIVAKVHRDDVLSKYERWFPSFSFSKHKGYGTVRHRQEISRVGPSGLHRRSFLRGDWCDTG